ncbi:MAG: SLATT domain-containing protein [Methanococcoides sp.]|nr:SLATT domain-containing protein [Methanococcoides sp.]
MDEINLNVVRETFGKVVYTHKTYEKAADICLNKAILIKRANVFLLVLTSGSALGSIISVNKFIVATSILSTISLFFIVYQLHFNYESKAQDYRYYARKLWLIREKYQNFIADIMNERYDSQEVSEYRDLLLGELNEILQNAIATDTKAYCEAQKALKVNEEMTFVDKEIDAFLPEKLRISEN